MKILNKIIVGARKASASADVEMRAKRALAETSLLALSAMFELTSEHVKAMKLEVAGWENGRRIGIGVLPQGPYVTIKFEDGKFKHIGKGLVDPHVSILFKNLDSAVLIFAGLIGAPQAVAENRVLINGDNSYAMQVTRAMAIVQTYLFPAAILNKTFKRPPKLSMKELAVKGKILGLLTPRLAKVASR